MSVAASVATTHAPSPQQQAVYDWVEKGAGSMNVAARAGAGKTTLLIHLSNQIQGRAFLGAFNKSIATELQDRITNPYCKAGTMHSLGFRLWKMQRPMAELDTWKVPELAKAAFAGRRLERTTLSKAVSVVGDAVGFAKLSGLGLPQVPNVDEAWDEIVEHYDLEDEVPPMMTMLEILEVSKRVYAQSLELAQAVQSKIDFNDMILAPLYFSNGVSPINYDWVLVDELQDASYTRTLLVDHVVKPANRGGRVVGVGDDFQSIYGFAGAGIGAMETHRKHFNAGELPLSVTYRCPKAVVKLAQTWVPDFTAHESAPEGKVTRIKHSALWHDQEISKDDLIICRNTRPLVGIAKRLRDQGVRCVVEGQSTKGMLALACKWGELTIDRFTVKLRDYFDVQIAKLIKAEKEEKAEQAGERLKIMLDVCKDLEPGDSIRKLMERIEWLFGTAQGQNVLRLCTIHRSKGREAGRVILVGRNLYQPSKWAKQPHEVQSERNLEYVAVTRAKNELVEVECPAKASSEEPDWWEL